MKLINNYSLLDNNFHIIKNYLEETINDVKIIHSGFSSISGIYTIPVIDIFIIISSINELPLLNDFLELSNYYFVKSLALEKKYYYQNKNTTLPPHNLYVIIKGDTAYLEEEAFKKYFTPELVIQYNKMITNIFPDQVDVLIYKEINNNYFQKLLIENQYSRNYFLVYPDFNNSLINITASLQKYYHVKAKYPSLSIVDKALKKKKNVYFVLIDGMGINIINEYLDETSFIRKNIKQTLTSIFPSTTVAATTSLLTGELPGETGWIGWQQYFSLLDRHVTMFKNEDYYNDKALPNFNVLDALKVHKTFPLFKATKYYEYMPHFTGHNAIKFDEMLNNALIDAKDENSFSYIYWSELDSLMHEYSTKSNIVKEHLLSLNNDLKKFAAKLRKDSLLIVSADHGMIDVLPIYFNRFSELNYLLRKKPAIEPRAVAFYVKDGAKDEFKKLFNLYFGNYFLLYTIEEIKKANLLGEVKKEFDQFLGDFVAIAIDKYIIVTNEEEYYQATHAGLTKDEMLIPLILFSK